MAKINKGADIVKFGLVLDLTKNEDKTADLIKNIRKLGFDIVSAFDKLHPWFEGGVSWSNRYSSCILINREDSSKDIQIICNEIYDQIPVFEISDWNNIDIKKVENFLSENNCKLWNLEDTIEEITQRITEFLPNETPIIDVSESMYSIIAAILVKRAIGERANRFVFYDRGIYSKSKIKEYLSALETIGIYPKYIDIKDKFKPEPDYTNRDVMHDYLMYTYEIHEVPLKELYGDTIDANGLVSTNNRDYTGILYDFVHHFSGVWRPNYAVKSITPCDRFFKSEFYEIARAIDLPNIIIDATTKLYNFI